MPVCTIIGLCLTLIGSIILMFGQKSLEKVLEAKAKTDELLQEHNANPRNDIIIAVGWEKQFVKTFDHNRTISMTAAGFLIVGFIFQIYGAISGC